MRIGLWMMSIVPLLMSHGATLGPAARSVTDRAISGPAIVAVDGSMLSRRVFLANPEENVRLFASLSAPMAPGDAEAARTTFGRRPHLDLWLFWGLRWGAAARDTASWSKLRVQESDERGRFYPAFKGQSAIIELDGTHGVLPSIRSVSPEALSILKGHGIPVRL